MNPAQLEVDALDFAGLLPRRMKGGREGEGTRHFLEGERDGEALQLLGDGEGVPLLHRREACGRDGRAGQRHDVRQIPGVHAVKPLEPQRALEEGAVAPDVHIDALQLQASVRLRNARDDAVLHRERRAAQHVFLTQGGEGGEQQGEQQEPSPASHRRITCQA